MCVRTREKGREREENFTKPVRGSSCNCGNTSMAGSLLRFLCYLPALMLLLLFWQVYISYGPKSNADLLLLYGFSLDRNPYNSVDVNISLDEVR